MASLTLKNLPDHLLDRLRALARRQRRSVTQQALFLIEGGLDETDARSAEQTSQAQIAAWRELAGRWISEQGARDEVEAVYEARTDGHEIEL